MGRMMLVLNMALICVVGLWSIPQGEAIDVNIGINIGTPQPPVVVEGPPPIVVDVPPQLVLIPGAPVYYAPTSPYNYFFHAGKYYVFHGGQWFRAPTYHGPWAVIAVHRVPPPVLQVPVAYYRVPPGHWKQHGPPPWVEHGKGHKHGKHDHKHGRHDHKHGKHDHKHGKHTHHDDD
jgi:hypothetical protein